MMVQVLYKIFLAVMLALFIGFGISVFYPSPKAPDYPISFEKAEPTAEQKEAQTQFEAKQKTFQADFAIYNRNISAIVITFSILMLIVSLTLLINVELMGDGLLFGGLLTLIYGMIRGIMSNDNKFQFIVVTVGLIVVLALGYIKFIRKGKTIKNA